MKTLLKYIVILMMCLIVSCSSKLENISGTWVIDNTKQKNNLSTFGTSLILGPEIIFQDNKCIITPMGLMKMALDVEQTKDTLYLHYEGSSFIIKIIDKNTIGIEMYGSNMLYKRKKD